MKVAKLIWFLLAFAALFALAANGQNTSFDLPTSQLLSQAGPTFQIRDAELALPESLIAYGDMRFTDPANVVATDPKVRKWLISQIAKERSAAVLLSGDIPLAGNVKNDYAVYREETKAWRELGIRIFPALGNHEFVGKNPQESLENWWEVFPEFLQRRWYSALIGSRVYLLALDSNASLLPGSDQARWLSSQVDALPATVDFVMICMHHPPVADVQTHIEVDHNPRPNEIALQEFLSEASPRIHARFIVTAGHIHNYERFLKDGVIYLVSGGGGAKPYYVERTADDKYQSILFPNYHYVKFVLESDRLRGTMYRIADPEAAAPVFEAKDSFEVMMKPRTLAH